MRQLRDNKHTLLLLGVFLMTIIFTAGCTKSSTKQTVQSVQGAGEEQEAVLEGIVTGNDTAVRQLTLRGLDSDMETIIAYDAAAELTDRYGEVRYGEDIEAGEIIEVTYSSFEGKLLSARVPEDIWEYQEVKEYSFNSDEQSMEFAGRKYQYLNTTYFASSGKPVELMELNKQDVLTVRGSGYQVYSVVRTQGHGYIRLSHYRDFVGGMIEVGNRLLLPVTGNMLITVRAGTYKVILSKGRAAAVKNVTVKTGEEVMLDFRDYQPVDNHIGTITFDIEPAGADLTLNRTAVNYQRPIALAYGTYRLEVSMTGYTTYIGTLDVEEPKSTLRINLVEEEAKVTKTTKEPSSKKSQKAASDGTLTKQMDSDHTITVSAPEGAEVYLDNVYKGLAPCTFTKVIGSQTITLRREGYITRSYSVDILDDGEDVKLSFAELAEAPDDTPAPTPQMSP